MTIGGREGGGGGGVNAKEIVSRFRCPRCKVGGQNKNTISLTYPMVTNLHLCNYCTKIFVIVVNTCVCRSSVDNKAAILSYHILSYPILQRLTSLVLGGGGGGGGGGGVGVPPPPPQKKKCPPRKV